MGCLVLLGLLAVIIGIPWYYIGMGCPDFWLSDRCAIRILKSSCGQSKEIEDVVSIDSIPAVADSRTVVFEYKRIPLPGESVSAETFRSNAIFVYQKTKLPNGEREEGWQTTCE